MVKRDFDCLHSLRFSSGLFYIVDIGVFVVQVKECCRSWSAGAGAIQ